MRHVEFRGQYGELHSLCPTLRNSGTIFGENEGPNERCSRILGGICSHQNETDQYQDAPNRRVYRPEGSPICHTISHLGEGGAYVSRLALRTEPESAEMGLGPNSRGDPAIKVEGRLRESGQSLRICSTAQPHLPVAVGRHRLHRQGQLSRA